MQKPFYILLFITIFSVIHGQKFPIKGMPEVSNYLPTDYDNKGKVWSMRSSKSGFLYMASDKALLVFDGQDWRTYKGSKGFIRSVYVVNDSLIYTGSDMDFGVWKRNALFNYEYQSLYEDKNKPVRESEEFWSTGIIQKNPVFVSHQSIFYRKNNKFLKFSAPSRFVNSFFSNGDLYLFDQKKGLLQFKDEKLQTVVALPESSFASIVGVYRLGGQLFLVSKDKGIWKVSNGKIEAVASEISQILKQSKTFSFTQLDASHLAFGTILNGLYITDTSGKVVHHLNKQKGLPNNTILGLHYDHLGDLWASMDYGISKISLNNGVNFFLDFDGNFGTGYAAALRNQTFFLGTNQGLYTIDWAKLDNTKPRIPFSIVSGSEGQVWSILNLPDDLLVGHDLGLFHYKEGRLQKIHDERGIWTMKLYRDQYLFTGNYNGVSIYEKKQGNWQFLKKVKGVLGSCNQIEIHGNMLWVYIPNYGVLRMKLDQNLEPKDKKVFLESEFEGDEIFLQPSPKGVYVSTSKFQYVFDEKLRKMQAKKMYRASVPFDGLLSGFTRAMPIDSTYFFYPIHNGFVLEDQKDNARKREKPVLVFTRLQGFNNNSTESFTLDQAIPYKFNNIRLGVIVPNMNHTIYQYKLDDDEEWSNWSSENHIELLNLKEGKHTVLIRAQVQDGLSEIKSVTFKVRAPWYRSWWAYLVYAFGLLGLFVWTRKRQKKQVEKLRKDLQKKEQRKLRQQQEQHEQEKRLLEQKRLERDKEILQQKVKDKTIELALKAKEDEDKNHLLQAVTEKIEDIEQNPGTSKMRLKEIRRLLKNYIETEDRTFEIQMDELHQEFFKSLKKEYPHLSIYDLRLSAYLRIGLNSKEMAEILQVLPSSINVSRSRLRKKLNLSPEEDLFDFLNQF